MRGAVRAFTIFLLTALFAASALADKKKGSWEGWHKFNLSIGAFFVNHNTALRLDATDGSAGTRISWEDNLGLDDSQAVFRLDGTWRYKRRSSMQFSYFDLSRDTIAPVNIDIRWGDEFFAAGTTLQTQLDLKIFRGSWGYSFIQRPNWDVHATIGLYAMDIFAGLQDPSTGAGDQGDVLAPLPVFGLGFVHKLRGKWILRGHAQFFAVTGDDYSGSLVDALFGAVHNTFKNVGFGVGYNVMDLDVDSTDEDWTGRLDLDYKGVAAFINIRLRGK
ncbi:MAG: hypothetical protein ACE5K1_09155 [Acidiferrobacterales bacterium]